MAKIFLIIGAIIAVGIIGCSPVKSIYLPNYSAEISYYGNSVEFYDGVNIKKCMLSDTVELNGYKCISWIHFFENGQVKQIETPKSIKMPNYTIPANSILFFYDQSPSKIQQIWFSQDVKVDSIECKGGAKISTEFYEHNQLKSCFLSKDQEIQGFQCESSLLKPVRFYPNGKIKMLTLGRDSKIANIQFEKGETICIGEDGSVSKLNNN